ncbi:unnamed protein product, partial [Rhizoctonia solani]
NGSAMMCKQIQAAPRVATDLRARGPWIPVVTSGPGLGHPPPPSTAHHPLCSFTTPAAISIYRTELQNKPRGRKHQSTIDAQVGRSRTRAADPPLGALPGDLLLLSSTQLTKSAAWTEPVLDELRMP